MKNERNEVDEIVVPNPLDDESFEATSSKWDRARNAMLVMPRAMSPNEMETMVRFLLGKIPRTLAFSLLSDLAEDSPIPNDILEQIFDRGDTGCKVSICLREDLKPSLERKCRDSTDESVREHYDARIRHRPRPITD